MERGWHEVPTEGQRLEDEFGNRAGALALPAVPTHPIVPATGLPAFSAHAVSLPKPEVAGGSYDGQPSEGANAARAQDQPARLDLRAREASLPDDWVLQQTHLGFTTDEVYEPYAPAPGPDPELPEPWQQHAGAGASHEFEDAPGQTSYAAGEAGEHPVGHALQGHPSSAAEQDDSPGSGVSHSEELLLRPELWQQLPGGAPGPEIGPRDPESGSGPQSDEQEDEDEEEGGVGLAGGGESAARSGSQQSMSEYGDPGQKEDAPDEAQQVAAAASAELAAAAAEHGDSEDNPPSTLQELLQTRLRYLQTAPASEVKRMLAEEVQELLVAQEKLRDAEDTARQAAQLLEQIKLEANHINERQLNRLRESKLAVKMEEARHNRQRQRDQHFHSERVKEGDLQIKLEEDRMRRQKELARRELAMTQRQAEQAKRDVEEALANMQKAQAELESAVKSRIEAETRALSDATSTSFNFTQEALRDEWLKGPAQHQAALDAAMTSAGEALLKVQQFMHKFHEAEENLDRVEFAAARLAQRELARMQEADIVVKAEQERLRRETVRLRITGAASTQESNLAVLMESERERREQARIGQEVHEVASQDEWARKEYEMAQRRVQEAYRELREAEAAQRAIEERISSFRQQELGPMPA